MCDHSMDDEDEGTRHVSSIAKIVSNRKTVSAAYDPERPEFMDSLWALWVNAANMRRMSRETIHCVHAQWINGHITILI